MEKIREHFADIWNCEIDHSIFQDRVSEIVEKTVEMVEQEHRWIPVTEQMPQELEAVEIWLKYAKISITAFWMKNGDVADGFVWIVSEFERNRCYAGDVSHWRKPQPPKDGDGE